MIHLRLRTEYNYKRAYGPIDKIIKRLKDIGATAAGISDVGTWGHVNFYNGLKKAGIKPILGAEIAIVNDAEERTKQYPCYMSFLAKNKEGLQEVYELVTRSTELFFYFPRLDYKTLQSVSDNVIVLTGSTPNLQLLKPKENMFFEMSFLTPKKYIDYALDNGMQVVATGDNYYPAATDKSVYEILLGQDRDRRTFPMHIPTKEEMQYHMPWLQGRHFGISEEIAAQCNVELPQAKMVKFKTDKTLEQVTREAAKLRGIDLSSDVYEARLQRELSMIKEKQFEDYFYVLWDLIHFAKTKMIVGPARGSSCGSLVCYALGITEVDPIPHDLLFERFIDVTRADLPDVDVDFADDRRDLVFDYLREQYGDDCVARLGTISRYKAKSAISQTAKELIVPEWEIKDLKDAILERSGGDARANFCIMDTFEQLDIGKEVLKKYPQMRWAAELESHASHSGQHAAGIVVTEEPVSNFCSFDKKTGALQVDKYDAEKLNLLKIDALGLRTLSILQDCIDQIGKDANWLYRLPIDDEKAFEVLNANRFSGIFQFEGYALKSLTMQMKVRKFDDIVAITALARPGPLNSGSAMDFVRRRIGEQDVEYLHPMVEDITKDTYGTTIFQEQVMRIVKEIGKFSWADTSTIRKAMSKSLGEEFFNRFWEKFKVGAAENGIDENKARHIWDHINTMGSWSFNKSHAVAYGLVSYWCCYLKAYWPLEFAAANLRNAKDDDQSVQLLRELHKEGIGYVAFDKDLSEENWSIKDGKLIGGFTGLKGCGVKKAADIVARRSKGLPLQPGQLKLVFDPKTPWDDIFECKTRFGHIRAEPEKHNIQTPIVNIEDIGIDFVGTVLFFGKLKVKNQRDMNEDSVMAKRGGKKIDVNNIWLNFTVEDDTGSIMCTINRFNYEKLGKPIVEGMVEGVDWLLIRAKFDKGFHIAKVERYRHMTPRLEKKADDAKKE